MPTKVNSGVIYVEVDAQSFSELLPYTQRTLFALMFGCNSGSKPKHVVHDSLQRIILGIFRSSCSLLSTEVKVVNSEPDPSMWRRSIDIPSFLHAIFRIHFKILY